MIDTGAVWARVRSRPATAVSTPTVLTVAMVVTLVAVVVSGVVAVRTTLARQAAADDVVTDAAPLLLHAQSLYVALADADAAATMIYLRAGTEDPALRRRYLDDIDEAMQRLASVGAAGLGPEARAAAATIATGLPVYTGRVEAARANSRQGLPVGAAYQREASELMREEILPASTAIYEDAVRGLDGRLVDGSEPTGPVALAISAGAALLLLVLTHAFVTIRTRRWLNAGLLAAIVVLVAGTIAGLVGLRVQREALIETRDEEFAFVTSLATARILTLRSASDENLDLIERGTDKEYMSDFAARVTDLGRGRDIGLLDVAAAAAPDGVDARTFGQLEDLYGEYRAVHVDIRDAARRREYPDAVELALGPQAAIVAELDAALDGLIDRAAVGLEQEAGRARDLPIPLPLVVAAAALVAGAAIIVGLRPRLREYR